MINGSPRLNGNTSIALDEMKKVFDSDCKSGLLCFRKCNSDCNT